MQKGFAIAIDGPVAAGKGTIAPILAKKLNGFYLYTGAFYRSLALLSLEKNVSLSDELLTELKIELLEDNKVLLNGTDVTDKINSEKVGLMASRIADKAWIRKEMVTRQKEVAQKFIDEGKIVVAEGRDTATRVFPDAKLKIFLTADPATRAKRRLDQLISRGENETLEKTLEGIIERDKKDQERKVDPLVKVPEDLDYFVLDDSNLTEEETINIILGELKKRGLLQ